MRTMIASEGAPMRLRKLEFGETDKTTERITERVWRWRGLPTLHYTKREIIIEYGEGESEKLQKRTVTVEM